MKRLAALVLVATALLGASSALAARHPRGESQRQSTACRPAHHRVIGADGQAVVYRALRPQSEERVYWGCLYGRKRAYEVGIAPQPSGSVAFGGTRNVTLAGPMVADELFSSARESLSRLIVQVRDLRTGRTIHEVPTGTPTTPIPASIEVVGAGPTTAIVVKADGAIAWIVKTAVFPPLAYEVHALDRTGSRTLAAGGDIAPHSLALAGSTLYWTQDGKPQSAPLH